MEHNPAIALFLALAVIIVASRVGGGLARRYGQPRVLGELIVGVLLGPTLLDMLHWGIFHGVHLEETIKQFAEIGVLMLMFLIGLEVHVSELLKVGRVAVLAGIMGAALPVLMTWPLMALFDYSWQPSLFAGVTLAATSVSISAQVLFELGYLNTKEGNALLATALIDDVLAIILVSVTVALVASGNSDGETDMTAIALIVGRMVAYLVIAFLVSWFFLSPFMKWIDKNRNFSQSEGLTATALVLMLLFAWSAEELGGVAAITGAFIAGLGLSRIRENPRHKIEHNITAMAYGFFVPIFFVDVGLEIDLSTFPLNALPLALLLLTVAVVSKVGGCGLGALGGGFTRGESLRVGVCMISRGEVGLIIAALAVSAGVFRPDDPLFSALFLVILLTTLVTPILVRWVFAHHSGNVVQTTSS